MNINASISYSAVSGFPAGTVVDHILVGIASSNPANDQSVSVAPDATSATFSNVPAGTYTVSARGVAASGGALGTPVSQNITLTAPVSTISLNLPSALSLSQS